MRTNRQQSRKDCSVAINQPVLCNVIIFEYYVTTLQFYYEFCLE
jgi:hypothetical protein